MKTDIEIANSVKLSPISEIAAKIGLKEDDLELYGKYKAKVNVQAQPKTDKLILVTAINPTSLGEGKTTTSIGLADGLAKIGKSVCLALREPSLGPVFGIKGGATGGGYAQIAPMEDINLHFTGDLHAITCANNLISAVLDNHLHQGNLLRINPTKIVWKRCLDMNDRALRNIVVGLGGSTNGVPREDGFNITAASEIMAVLCLSKDLKDLKRRISNIIVGYNYDNEAVRVGDLQITDSVAIVLKDALKPNLVQTLEGTPCFVHGGPFANIAHGCNSIIATKVAMSYADYVVTEAGFGADLGAEKFLDIKCRAADIEPKAIVLVATVRALKYNGGASKDNLTACDLESLKKGMCNLVGHIENLNRVYNASVVVAINKFITDDDREIEYIEQCCREQNASFALCESWAKGGEGAVALANAVVDAVENNNKKITYAYDLDASITEKINAVATKIYGADKVEYSAKALSSLKQIQSIGLDKLPICIAKTQYSFSDDPAKLGRPRGFTLLISDLQVRGGAEFIVAVAGSIMLMPGLSKKPSAMGMSINDETGEIKGLF